MNKLILDITIFIFNIGHPFTLQKHILKEKVKIKI